MTSNTTSPVPGTVGLDSSTGSSNNAKAETAAAVAGGSYSSPTNTNHSTNNQGGTTEDGDMIKSLGVALAGVTLTAGTAGDTTTTTKPGGGTNTNGGGGGLFHHTSGNDGGASPFSSMAGTGPTTQSTTTNESDLAWSSTFSGSTAAPAPSADGGITGGGTGAQQQREGLELFLSQSPSQTLGDDVFKLSSTNLPALAGGTTTPGGGGGNGGKTSPFPMSAGSAGGGGAVTSTTTSTTMPSGFPTQNGVIGEIRGPDGRRRNDSPLGSGTTTSSRSVSPYAPNTMNKDQQRGAIPAFSYNNGAATASMNSGPLLNSRQASYAEDDRQENGHHYGHGHPNSHPNLPALDHRAGTGGQQQRYGDGQQRDGPKNLFGSMGTGSPYDSPFDNQNGGAGGYMAPPQQQQRAELTASPQQLPPPQQLQQQQQGQPQPQVLYMAVPAPDGRGQVLQPVQILQQSGKPVTYVVPQGAGGNMDPNQGMRVLPPVQNNQGGAMGVVESRNPKNYSLDGLGSKMSDYQYSNGASNTGIVGQDKFNIPGGDSSLYATTQRPPLETLLGQVRRLSRDQVGCRLVQQALDEEGPMAATLILNEGLPFWSEAMVDPFGNYLFQKILEKITPEERIMLVKTVSSRLVNASLNLHGTRSVQKIVELCSIDEENGVKAKATNGNGDAQEESAADILTRALSPAAARLCIDSHGNHVIQRILLKLGPKHSKFVFDAVAASVGDVARHRHGCCVIQRCLDSPDSESRSHLVHRIVDKSLELMQDAYGNYVVQYVLDVCSDSDVHLVCESVVGKVCLLAIQKFSSNVMEKCLERCTDSVKEMYLQELSDQERIRELMMDPFGNYVVQRALSVATHSQAIRLVEAMRPHLIATQPGFPNTGQQRNGGVRNTAGGRRIMAKICRRFPNFTLSAVGSQEELFSQNKHQHRQSPQMQMMPGQGHGLATYATMQAGPPRVQHQHQLYGGDPNAILGDPNALLSDPSALFGDPNANLGPHLAMNQQQAYYGETNMGNMGTMSNMSNMGYYDHFSGHGAFQNM